MIVINHRGGSLQNHVIQNLDSDFVNILIPIHALSGADCLSKVGTKNRAIKEGVNSHYLLSGFGQQELTDEMVSKAEKFLLRYVTKHEIDTLTIYAILYIMRSTKSLILNASRQLQIVSDNTYYVHIYSLINGYTVRYWKTFHLSPLNMVTG